MYKLYVCRITMNGGCHSLVIEFDTEDAADVAFEKLSSARITTVVKLY